MDPTPVLTKSGRTLSGYAPIQRLDGTVVAVLGMDIGAERIQVQMRPVLRTTAQVGGLGSVLFMGMTVVAAVRVLRRKKKTQNAPLDAGLAGAA